ncbi:hypothetical protein [Microcella indica]|jgi:hypothetical protein|uniref:hypothetical protein n=1 Tax=Microcella indica TaxID=2750620 RepID=UPI0015CF7F06|nr:hypothetical protein [Microcella indica]MBU1250100.1 hypothetical protein [Actinomycetota bacterium]MBU1608083.1 hypothetical protein [Actinomycetota bacterium]MBU2315045.1 hypothetical protein [Actinomycetota bacterium]MBU2384572.1 hypothetical protein [Actinomycetota bacterium]
MRNARDRAGPRLAAIVAVTAVTVTIAGCSPRVLESPSGLLVPVAAEYNGMEALLEGELATTSGGCLAVRWGEPATVTVIVTAPGTRLEGDSAVVMPGHESLTVGDTVALGGGFRNPDDWPENIALPAECDSETEVFFVNSGG